MSTGGVIIAGGRSSRMGREKAMVPLAGRPLIDWIISRIAPQVDGLAINANSETLRSWGLPVLPDVRPDIGTPVAGLHAALVWGLAQGFERVLTVPSDSPFLPGDLVARLATACPAIAVSEDGRPHFLTGLWPVGLLTRLEAAMPARVREWVDLAGATLVTWPSRPCDPFFNINTPEDLANAERLAAEFHP